MNRKAKPMKISIDDFENIYYFATTEYLNYYFSNLDIEKLTDKQKRLISTFQERTKGILITFKDDFYYYSTENFIDSAKILKNS